MEMQEERESKHFDMIASWQASEVLMSDINAGFVSRCIVRDRVRALLCI
jgi:hypothetical protein